MGTLNLVPATSFKQVGTEVETNSGKGLERTKTSHWKIPPTNRQTNDWLWEHHPLKDMIVLNYTTARAWEHFLQKQLHSILFKFYTNVFGIRVKWQTVPFLFLKIAQMQSIHNYSLDPSTATYQAISTINLSPRRAMHYCCNFMSCGLTINSVKGECEQIAWKVPKFKCA